MPRLHLSWTNLEIPFKQAFVHATASRSCTESLLVKARSAKGLMGMGEGCPRSYVTGETLETARTFFENHCRSWEQLNGLKHLQDWMADHHDLINANPAAWCAVELALLDVWGQESGQSIEMLLGLSEITGTFQYSAVLGTDSLSTFERQARKYSALGLTDFKVKISGCLKDDQHKINFLNRLGLGNLRIRLDANNLWHRPEDAVSYLESLPHVFWAVEEPLTVGDYEGCRTISSQLGLPIILDENFLRGEQFQVLEVDSKGWIINLRVSKMGGIFRSLNVARQAKQLSIPIIIGAQVGETSILTRAALTVANQYRDILLAQEGAFGTYLLEHDITDAPLMFGQGGTLMVPSVGNPPGLGFLFNDRL